MTELETPFFPQLQIEILPSAGSLRHQTRFSYDPVDVNYAYHSGFLYYPIQTLVCGTEIHKRPDGTEESVATERLETIVVRSDRSFHIAKQNPAPRGTPAENRVWRLGELALSARPRASTWASWRWQSIRAYLDGSAVPRPLGEIMRDIVRFLERAVYLPRREDYILLAACVPLTYVQTVFDAVPLLLLQGEHGTGKSLLGNYMARLCCNGTTVGVVSPATIARQIDESRGFVALDDLESVGRRKGRDGSQFGELVQALKLSYNQKTAVKIWTDVTRMRTQRLNFYGVKLISNTRGTDDILGSRMLRINTGPIPPEARGKFSDAQGAERLLALRDELHVWAFTNVNAVAEAYARDFPAHASRSDEIVAPLSVIMKLTGDQELQQQLSHAVQLQQNTPRVANTLEELLLWAVERLIRNGQSVITPLQVLLEMRYLADNHQGRKLRIDHLNTPWIGRLLRSEGIIESTEKGNRKRLYGHNIRLCTVRRDYIEHVRSLARPVRVLGSTEVVWKQTGPLDFCERWWCSVCRFAAHGCPIRARKLAAGRRQEREELLAAKDVA
jgi:hypothetical protein